MSYSWFPLAEPLISETFERFTHIGRVLPAVGYGEAQAAP
jgi:predicted GTPase